MLLYKKHLAYRDQNEIQNRLDTNFDCLLVWPWQWKGSRLKISLEHETAYLTLSFLYEVS